jgi:hypothetical protein
MGQRERWILFLVGALVGVGVLWVVQTNSQPQRDAKRQVREGLNLPGMMYDFAVTQKGFYGHYVLWESVETRADGSKVRSIVTGGRRHYEASGRELAQEYLLTKETYAAGTALAEAGPVIDYSFQFADRIALKLKPGHLAAEVKLPSGDVAQPVPGKPDEALLPLKKWHEPLEKTPWADLPNVLAAVRADPAVASAELITIDWKKEAEIIRANSGQK